MIYAPNFYKRTFDSEIITEDVFSSLLSDRIIMLFHEITDDVAYVVISQLLYLEAADPNKDIYLYINSPGGSVQAGLAIYDVMRHIKCDVNTVCVGSASSMGAFLLAAGTKGKRYSLKHSSILIHQTLANISYSQATDIEIRANHIAKIKKQTNKLLAKMTGKTEDEIEKATDRDNFLTPQEAVEFGLIDEVIIDD